MQVTAEYNTFKKSPKACYDIPTLTVALLQSIAAL